MDFKDSDWVQAMNRYGREGIPFLFVIDFAGTHAKIFTRQELSSGDCLYKIGSHGNTGEKSPPSGSFHFSGKAVEYEEYERAFSRVMHHIHRGDTYLVNLTFPTPLQTDLRPVEIFRRSQAPYKLFLPGLFVVFSPECFVKIREGKIFCYPMKGTMDAAIPGAREKLLADPKEIAEHNTIVDLIRNDLSAVASRVRVEEYRYIDVVPTNFKTLLQVSSRISGVLPEDYTSRLGSLMAALLPAGSVTGAPKEKTVQVIRDTETYERGFYTGVFGYFDGHDLDSAVMIRFIEETPQGLVFKSGGGITCFSSCEMEYKEMIDKVYVPFV